MEKCRLFIWYLWYALVDDFLKLGGRNEKKLILILVFIILIVIVVSLIIAKNKKDIYNEDKNKKIESGIITNIQNNIITIQSEENDTTNEKWFALIMNVKGNNYEKKKISKNWDIFMYFNCNRNIFLDF